MLAFAGTLIALAIAVIQDSLSCDAGHNALVRMVLRCVQAKLDVKKKRDERECR